MCRGRLHASLGPGLSLSSFVLLHFVSVVCEHIDMLSWSRVKALHTVNHKENLKLGISSSREAEGSRLNSDLPS